VAPLLCRTDEGVLFSQGLMVNYIALSLMKHSYVVMEITYSFMITFPVTSHSI